VADGLALAVALVLLMALPAATCRRAPVASAVTALAAALGAAALGYPPTSGWFSALLIAAAAVYVTDRRRAIAQAINSAAPGDVVVIAGKGHEQGQEFENGRKEPFDDVSEARSALRARLGAHA
jgi:hypothetical protein